MLQLNGDQELRFAKWSEGRYELIIHTKDTYDGETVNVHRTGLFFTSYDMNEYNMFTAQFLAALAAPAIKCRKV